MAGYKSKYPKKKYGMKKKKSKRPARLAPSVRRAVTKIASKVSHEETKHASRTLENLVGHNSPIGVGDAAPLMPLIAQGATDYSRIGDRITPTALYIKGRLGLTYNSQDNNRPVSVRVMVLSQRNITDSTMVASNFSPANMLSANDPVAGLDNVSYDGTVRNALYPVNKNFFKCHYMRDFTMTPALANGTDAGIESQTKNSIVKWGAKVTLPKTLLYFSSASQYPQNAAPFLVIGYCYPDGSSVDTITVRVTSTTVSTLYFKDA